LQKAKNDAIHNNKTSTVNTKKFGFDTILIWLVFPAIAYPVEKVLQQQQLQVKKSKTRKAVIENGKLP
jgi:hypothetical protein